MVKKILLLMLLLCFAGWCYASDPTPSADWSYKEALSTLQRPYDLTIRTCDTNDTALTASTKYWDYIKPVSGTVRFTPIIASYNRMELAFVCDGNTKGGSSDYNDPNLTTFNFKVYAARYYSGAKLVCSGTAACGEQGVSRDPNYAANSNIGIYNSGSLATAPKHKWISGVTSFVGTTNITQHSWPTPVYLADCTQGDDGISTITFDLQGYGLLWVEITSITGNPGHIRVVATGW